MKPCPKGHKDCPHPADDSFAEIEFTPRKKMVDWLGPLQLADTGFKAVVAATFGSYADKREVEVSVSPFDGVEYLDLSNKSDEVWFDYIADLGDGFNPSYAMAYLMAKDTLTVGEHRLPRGEVVILGGDQVYPTSNRDAYQNQFIGPYRSALPWRPENETRSIYSIPGNHDWYDGLTSYLRIFCQARDKTGRGARWIGAWRASQRRSYFAIRLPGNWWVWGIDGQLESDMDKPQLNYFADLGDAIAKMGGEHKIVLVTPEPNWVYCGGEGSKKMCALVEPERFNTLAHFEKRYVRAKGLRLAMVIAGDLHHYVHYESEDHLAHR
ncbi:MAG TPA: metallophosphoesterase, partial [Thermoanaerobaculia bacterium]|nr:metallophosphoesterase [Thermoanaerobaculia bacterium]